MKRKGVRSVVVAAAMATLIAAGSGTAFAGNVSWQNAWASSSGFQYQYLNENSCFGCTHYIGLYSAGDPANAWTDTMYSDGGWTEVNGFTLNCLDSNFNGSVYPHTCESQTGSAPDYYQRWYEISTPTGWALQDDQTLYFLDVDNNLNVYTNSTNYGDSDAHQRWH